MAPIIHNRRSMACLLRCLFLMTERLRGDSSLERSLAHSWLTSALQRADTARLFEPVLAALLHPHTRRVSVQRFSIQKVEQGQCSNG